MKLYSNYKASSISLKSNHQLTQLIEQHVLNRVSTIIETGTYDGLGSTKLLATIFQNSPFLKKFYTCEVDFLNFSRAKKNLAGFSFVECKYGASVSIREGINFIENDDVLRYHEAVPEIFIDDIVDPIGFYTRELRGLLSTQTSYFAKFLQFIRQVKPSENLLRKLIEQHKDDGIIFLVLDSAGGLGFLEFQIVLNTLSDREFFILLDDTHHIKHFRSRRAIDKNQRFNLIGDGGADGWALAQYNPTVNL